MAQPNLVECRAGAPSGAHDLIYAESAKHAPRAVASAAICVIAAERVALPGKTVCGVRAQGRVRANQRAAASGRAPIASGIHPTAIVAPLARLAPDAGYRAVRRHW